MQWFSLLTVRTRRRSIVQQDPLFDPRSRNLRLFGAGPASLALGLCVVAFLSRSPEHSPRLTRLYRSAPHIFHSSPFSSAPLAPAPSPSKPSSSPSRTASCSSRWTRRARPPTGAGRTGGSPGSRGRRAREGGAGGGEAGRRREAALGWFRRPLCTTLRRQDLASVQCSVCVQSLSERQLRSARNTSRQPRVPRGPCAGSLQSR